MALTPEMANNDENTSVCESCLLVVKGKDMTHDEFIQKNKRIADLLDKIAQRTEKMAWANCAKSANHEFVAIIQLQEKLLIDAENLLKEFEKSNCTGV